MVPQATLTLGRDRWLSAFTIMGALHACISKCCEGRSFLRRVGPSRAVESGVPLFSRGLFSRFMSSLTSPDEVSRSTTMGRGCRPAGWERQRVDFAGRGPSTHGTYLLVKGRKSILLSCAPARARSGSTSRSPVTPDRSHSRRLYPPTSSLSLLMAPNRLTTG